MVPWCIRVAKQHITALNLMEGVFSEVWQISVLKQETTKHFFFPMLPVVLTSQAVKCCS